MTPTRISVPDDVLADLHARLASTRWPDAIDETGWDYGIPPATVRELAERWESAFDWRAVEAELNSWPHHTTTIDDQHIHFIHARSEDEGALPLVLTHGWPGSVIEFLDILGPLTAPGPDAFHVVAPSLPGYGWSGPTTERGWSVARVGAAWAELMAMLGYDRYGAQGGDWGSMVSQAIGKADPEHCFAIHLNFAYTTPPEGADPSQLSETEQAAIARANEYFTDGMGYAQIHGTRPQSLAYALEDSPVGLLAWIAEKFHAWTDNDGTIASAVDLDRLLANITTYWVTGTAGSSARLYYETMHDADGLAGAPPVPVGIASFPMEIMQSPRSWLEDKWDVVHWTDMPRGGHFAALEEPDLLVEDVRAFFRPYR